MAGSKKKQEKPVETKAVESAAIGAPTELPPDGHKFIDQVVDYDRDIKPHHVTLLVAGVGAGKTTFLGKLIDKGLNVLEITSRRAIADEQRSKLDAIPKVSEIKDTIASKKICVLTNRQIELFYRQVYRADDPDTHIWNYFDVCALDEAHSLVTDASFADSVFYVQNFLKIAIRESVNCHFMFMTGTPEPIEYLFKKGNYDLLDPKTPPVNRLDHFKTCRHVMPKRVMPVDQDRAFVILKELLDNNEKVIYFSRTIDNIVNIKKKFAEEYKNDPKHMPVIGVDFSDEGRKDDFSSDDRKRRSRIRDSLRDDSLIPNDIQLFLSTTKNKEGINIDNTDIHYVFAESNLHSELRQMSGRLRNFTDYECFFIVYDQFWEQQMAEGMFRIETERGVFTYGLDAYDKYRHYARKYTSTSTVHSFQSPILSNRELQEKLYMIKYLPFDPKPQWFKAKEESFRLSIRNSYELHDYISHWNDKGWGMVKDVDETGKELGTEHLVNLHEPDYFTALDKYQDKGNKEATFFKWRKNVEQPMNFIDEEQKKLAEFKKKATRKLTGKECLNLWFPGASIEQCPPIPTTPEAVAKVFVVQFYNILDKLGMQIGVPYEPAIEKELIKELNILLKKIDYKQLGISTVPIKTLNPLLKHVSLYRDQPTHARSKYVLEVVEQTLPEEEGGCVDDVEDTAEEPSKEKAKKASKPKKKA